MVGNSITSPPIASMRCANPPACLRARVTTMRRPPNGFSLDIAPAGIVMASTCRQDLARALMPKLLGQLFAEILGFVGTARELGFAEHRAIRAGNDGDHSQDASRRAGAGTDRHVASAAQAAQQRALCRGLCFAYRIMQKTQHLLQHAVVA